MVRLRTDSATGEHDPDLDALTWHAASVLTDPGLRSTLVERGLAQAARFNWDRTADEMVALYRDVAAKAA